jgi:predicted MPP superfamily phosphohydrolase
MLYTIIQGGYVAINHFILHSTQTRLNIDWLLIFGTVASLTIFAFIVRGILIGRFDFKVLKETIHFDTLPDAFDGLRAVQISDIHIGSFYQHKDQIAKAVDMVNSLKPDIIFFTGDMVNNVAEELKGFEPILAKLQAPLGKFSILGNHDYGDYVKWESKEAKIKNLDTLKDLQQHAGFDLLLNENRLITKNGQQIAVIGVENWGTPPFAQYGQLPVAVKGTENTPFRILLSHDPSHWDVEVAKKTDIQLTLAGHTHGMQFGIRIGDWQWSPVQWRYERWHGLYTHLKQHLYVNRGLGHIGFPGRVGMLPEITLLEFRK